MSTKEEILGLLNEAAIEVKLEYIMIYQEETDGNIKARRVSKEELLNFEPSELDEVFIVKGKLLKTDNQKFNKKILN